MQSDERCPDLSCVKGYLATFPWHTELFSWLEYRYGLLVGTIISDYRRRETSGVLTCHPRHKSYMRDLVAHFGLARTPSDIDIRRHFIAQDPQRVFYMLNPNNN
jgi:hypothetical protein